MTGSRPSAKPPPARPGASRATSNPQRPGIQRSIKSSAGRASRTIASASAPSAASKTSKPPSRRAVAHEARYGPSSSASTILESPRSIASPRIVEIRPDPRNPSIQHPSPARHARAAVRWSGVRGISWRAYSSTPSDCRRKDWRTSYALRGPSPTPDREEAASAYNQAISDRDDHRVREEDGCVSSRNLGSRPRRPRFSPSTRAPAPCQRLTPPWEKVRGCRGG